MTNYFGGITKAHVAIADQSRLCPLSGVKRTCLFALQNFRFF